MLRRESLASRLSYVAPVMLAAVLLAAPDLPVSVLARRFVPASAWSFVAGAILTMLGLLFSIWARRYLGTNWSATVTIKQRHELVTDGPYAHVRHPIYSGLLLAMLGSAIAVGEWRALFAVALALLALWRKLWVEERWMQQHFGDAYRAYRRNVPALIPFLPRRSH